MSDAVELQFAVYKSRASFIHVFLIRFPDAISS